MAVSSRSRSSGMWHRVMLLMDTSLLGELAASILRAGRDHLSWLWRLLLPPKLWYPSTKLHRITYQKHHYLDLTVCEYYLVERCCELGNEHYVIGAEFIYQLSDYQCPRNLPAWCRGL